MGPWENRCQGLQKGGIESTERDDRSREGASVRSSNAGKVTGVRHHAADGAKPEAPLGTVTRAETVGAVGQKNAPGPIWGPGPRSPRREPRPQSTETTRVRRRLRSNGTTPVPYRSVASVDMIAVIHGRAYGDMGGVNEEERLGVLFVSAHCRPQSLIGTLRCNAMRCDAVR